jgi:hypothetical protein
VEITCTDWVYVETTTSPCVNGFENKVKTTTVKGVDGSILVTFRVHSVSSNTSDYVDTPPLLGTSSKGENSIVTRIKGVVRGVTLPDT